MTIDPEVVDPEDVEMLQDLMAAAINEAVKQVPRAGHQAAGGGHRRAEDPGLM